MRIKDALRELKHPKSWSLKTKIIVPVVAVLIVARLALPYGIQWYGNKVLNQNTTYRGRIGKVRVHLWRGAYTIHDVDILKRASNAPVPFFRTQKINMSLSWKDLIHFQIVAKVKFTDPTINFVDAKNPKDKVTGKNANWNAMLKQLAPFRISRLEVQNGSIHFQNFESRPPVDIWTTKIGAYVENLTNSRKLAKNLFATVHATGVTLGGGKLDMDIRINPNTPEPTFSLREKLIGMDLTALNKFFNEYANFDFVKGRADIVSELDVANGNMNGYVKPLFHDVQVLSLKNETEEGHSIFRIAWQATVGAVIALFKNQPKDQFATRVPVQGRLEHPDQDILATIGGVLRNAFISAFTPFYDDGEKKKFFKSG